MLLGQFNDTKNSFRLDWQGLGSWTVLTVIAWHRVSMCMNCQQYLFLVITVVAGTWLTLPCAWRCGKNGFTARLEFPYHMVITSRNFIWLTSLAWIVLASCYNPRFNPIIPKEQTSWYIICLQQNSQSYQHNLYLMQLLSDDCSLMRWCNSPVC